MAKVTSKLQVTIPRRLATEYDIEPGDEIEFVPAGDVIRVVPPAAKSAKSAADDLTTRLEIFDAATRRQEDRQRERAAASPPEDRGWRREDLHVRERSE